MIYNKIIKDFCIFVLVELNRNLQNQNLYSDYMFIHLFEYF